MSSGAVNRVRPSAPSASLRAQRRRAVIIEDSTNISCTGVNAGSVEPDHPLSPSPASSRSSVNSIADSVTYFNIPSDHWDNVLSADEGSEPRISSRNGYASSIDSLSPPSSVLKGQESNVRRAERVATTASLASSTTAVDVHPSESYRAPGSKVTYHRRPQQGSISTTASSLFDGDTSSIAPSEQEVFSPLPSPVPRLPASGPASLAPRPAPLAQVKPAWDGRWVMDPRSQNGFEMFVPEVPYKRPTKLRPRLQSNPGTKSKATTRGGQAPLPSTASKPPTIQPTRPRLTKKRGRAATDDERGTITRRRAPSESYPVSENVPHSPHHQHHLSAPPLPSPPFVPSRSRSIEDPYNRPLTPIQAPIPGPIPPSLQSLIAAMNAESTVERLPSRAPSPIKASASADAEARTPDIFDCFYGGAPPAFAPTPKPSPPQSIRRPSVFDSVSKSASDSASSSPLSIQKSPVLQHFHNGSLKKTIPPPLQEAHFQALIARDCPDEDLVNGPLSPRAVNASFGFGAISPPSSPSKAQKWTMGIGSLFRPRRNTMSGTAVPDLAK